MRWWPFGRTNSKAAEIDEPAEAESITLYQTDSPRVRAEKILRASGMRINRAALIMIPHVADAIAAYQRMDAEVAAQSRE